jgi:hypothetical protein
VPWLTREFMALYRGLLSVWDMDVLAHEPGKLSEGMVRYADGTEWNPGAGKGLYVYDGQGWQPTFTPGAVRSRMPLLTEPPATPEAGMVVLADGVNWDPGAGAGLYFFDGVFWRKA